MTTTRYRHARIAAAGLDLLHMTRLKVACSLLMAERLDVDLCDWPGADVDLLVAGTDEGPGTLAAAHARRLGVAVLDISREGGSALRHGVTVKDLSDRLFALLSGAVPVTTPTRAAPEPPPAARTALDHLGQSAEPSLLLELDGLRVLVDRERQRLHLASAGAVDAAAASCGRTDWRARALPLAERGTLLADCPVALPLEGFVWRAAVAGEAEVGAYPREAWITLRGWPAIDIGSLPAHWLLPLGCLLHGAWSSASLARACGMPPAETARIFAAIHHSGLAQQAGRPARAAVPPPAPRAGDMASSSFLARAARRFGLYFGGQRE